MKNGRLGTAAIIKVEFNVKEGLKPRNGRLRHPMETSFKTFQE